MNTINTTLPINRLTQEVVDCIYTVHKNLGPGLLESIYETCLCYELEKRNIAFERQKTLPISYKDVTFEAGLRLDILIEKQLIIELKSVEKILPVHEAQIISYLKLANKDIGFLVNFNVELIKQGIKRYISTK